jgi:Putative metallopeptidase
MSRFPMSGFSSQQELRVTSMKSIVNAAVAGAVLALAAQAVPAAAQIPADLKNDQIEISYVEPKNPAFRPIYDKLKQRQVLEQLRAFMAPLSLTRKLPVTIDQCGTTTKPFEPGGGVTICYEYIAEIERLAPKEKTALGVTREVATAGAFVQVVLHEMSHAVFDVLQVPVWGREEDAADKLAGFIMLQFGKDVALTTLTGTAHFFEASDHTWTGSDFSDVRSPEAQRFFNYLCLAHGGPSSEAFRPFLQQVKSDGKSFLQLDRAARCSKEYADLRWAFQKTILPHVDQDLMQKVQAMQIFLPADVGKQ